MTLQEAWRVVKTSIYRTMDRAPRAPAPRNAAAELIDAAWSLQTPAETAHPKSGLRPIFRTRGLTIGELAICVGLSSIVFVAVELEKVVRRRRPVAAGGPGGQNGI